MTLNKDDADTTLQKVNDAMFNRSNAAPPEGLVHAHVRGQPALVTPIDESAYIDPIAMAKKMLRDRQETALQTKIRESLRFTKWMTILLLVVAVIAGGIFVGRQMMSVSPIRVTDERPCSAMVGNIPVEGVREYSYQHYDLFGFRFIDTKAIAVTTKIKYNGTGLIVVGQTGADWWSAKMGAGEIGVVATKPAATYTFIIGGRVEVVSDAAFCK